jgi:asparagine synthase (glutamine-hydrolysing)
MGLRVASPFTREPFKEWALGTGKQDCIQERLLEARPGEDRIAKITGKVPLREAFPDAVSAWRLKDPIEVGSGSTMLGANGGEFFLKFSDKETLAREQERILREHAIVIRDSEHLFYFNAFCKAFSLFDATADISEERIAPIDETEKESTGLRIPDRIIDHKDACIACHYLLPLPETLFCKVCGAWPARKTT